MHRETSSLRSMASVIKATESGRQSQKLKMVKVTVEGCWSAVERARVVWDPTIWLCLEFSTDLLQRSHIDPAPAAEVVKSYQAHYPILVSRPILPESGDTPACLLHAAIREGVAFADAEANVPYAPASSRLSSSLGKQNEFATLVAQHLCHQSAPHAVYNRRGEEVEAVELGASIKERAYLKLVSEAAEASQCNLQGPLTRLLNMKSRLQRVECGAKQLLAA
eukprot:3264908-Amphidinium_carterae.1